VGAGVAVGVGMGVGVTDGPAQPRMTAPSTTTATVITLATPIMRFFGPSRLPIATPSYTNLPLAPSKGFFHSLR
jgi:hypothetical protein